MDVRWAGNAQPGRTWTGLVLAAAMSIVVVGCEPEATSDVAARAEATVAAAGGLTYSGARTAAAEATGAAGATEVAEVAEPAVSPPVFDIALSDAGFTAPPEIPAGIVAMRFENTSRMQEGQPVLARLNEGATIASIAGVLSSGDPGAFESVLGMLTSYGSIMPGTTIYDLEPGQHLAVFAGNVGEGVPPFAPIQVVESDNGATAPKADVTVRLVDFAFGMPAEVKAGPQVWRFENAGSQAHHLLAFELPEGVTMADITTWAEAPEPGPPPFIGADGAPTGNAFAFEFLSPGAGAWAEMDVPPGEYAVFCLLPDFTTDPPLAHLSEGMHGKLIVTE